MRKTAFYRPVLFAAAVLVIAIIILSVGSGEKGPRGRYVDNLGLSAMTFSGSSVTLKSLDANSPHPVNEEGTFTLHNDILTIQWNSGLSDTITYHADTDSIDYYGIIRYTKK